MCHFEWNTLQSLNEDHISNDLKPKAYLWFRVLEVWNILRKILVQNNHLGQLFVSDEPRPILDKIWNPDSKPYPISKPEIHLGPYDLKFTRRRCALPQRGISAQSIVGTRSRVILRYQSRTLNTYKNRAMSLPLNNTMIWFWFFFSAECAQASFTLEP